MSRGWDCDADGYDTLRDLFGPLRTPTHPPIAPPVVSVEPSPYWFACPTCGTPAHVECRMSDDVCPARAALVWS